MHISSELRDIIRRSEKGAAPWQADAHGNVDTDPPAIDPLADRAFEANQAHEEAVSHSKGMAVSAHRAGVALLAAKEQVPHGGFKAWCEANLTFSVRQAQRYMKIAKNVDVDAFDPDASIESILDTTGRRKRKEAAEEAPTGSGSGEEATDDARASDHGNDHVVESEPARRDGEAILAIEDPEMLEILEPFMGLSKERLLVVVFAMFKVIEGAESLSAEEIQAKVDQYDRMIGGGA